MKITRRDFISSAALASAAFTIVPSKVMGKNPPSEKLNIAGIGVGGIGALNLRNVETENIVALCDIDDKFAAKTYNRYPQAKTYRDYRIMLEKQRDIDAVIVATPDHTHAVITMAAIKAGKHVYCQKPLTHDIYEGRMLAKAAREANIVSQMGIQGNSEEGIRLTCEWIWDGAIGNVREVDAWCNLSYYPPGHASWSSKLLERPEKGLPVPANVDWDIWLGPAPFRPYHWCYHPSTWRCWRDFGSGMLGDRGCHTLDTAFKSLKLTSPTAITATSMGDNKDVHPISSLVQYEFPKRGDLPPVKINWYDGLNAPRPEELEDGRRMGDNEGGLIFKGDKGKIMCGTCGDSPRIIPESKMKSYQRPEKTLPRIKGSHEQSWVNCCKAGIKAGADFDYSSALTELVLLGNIAIAVKDKLRWDGENIKFTNNSKANEFIKTKYRPGWSL